jgi:hypothetical protein
MAIINCPCSKGFIIPKSKEWIQEVNSWESRDAAGVFNSPLNLTLGGYRNGFSLTGNLEGVGGNGNYWPSNYYDTKAVFFKIEPSFTSFYDVSFARILIEKRAQDFTVRCIKEL